MSELDLPARSRSGFASAEAGARGPEEMIAGRFERCFIAPQPLASRYSRGREVRHDRSRGRPRPRLRGLRTPPARPQVARRRACRGQFRHQLRGRRRALRARRRPGERSRPDRGLDRQLCRPRPRRREHVRVRQPRRLLAPAPHVHPAQAPLHGVRHRPRARAQPGSLCRHARGRLGRGGPRLQVGDARHHGAGLREEADRDGDREHHPDHRHAAGRLVQPLCALDADAQSSARRRLRVRQRHL